MPNSFLSAPPYTPLQSKHVHRASWWGGVPQASCTGEEGQGSMQQRYCRQCSEQWVSESDLTVVSMQQDLEKSFWAEGMG